MISRRNGLKAAIALPLASMLPQPAKALTFEERAAEFIEEMTHYELMSVSWLTLDVLASRIENDVPHEWTTKETLEAGGFDIADLHKWASHIIHCAIVTAMADHVSE